MGFFDTHCLHIYFNFKVYFSFFFGIVSINFYDVLAVYFRKIISNYWPSRIVCLSSEAEPGGTETAVCIPHTQLVLAMVM